MSPVAKVRFDGTWAEAELTGAARLGGAWTRFSRLKTEESFAFDGTLAGTYDDGRAVALGLRWTASSPGLWIGCAVWVARYMSGLPLTVAAYNADTQVELSRAASAPTAELQSARVMFAKAVPVSPGVPYMATYHARFYVASFGTLPTISAHMTSDAGSRWIAGDEIAFPVNGSQANYHVTPLVLF
ncbi:hypothetical protein [Actinoplanes philippinensis]|uniref:hypothetical protein n=1 Tax=Actinoplanes philippinensis TaxID=35752 RepID=UPI0033D4F975